MLSSADSFEQDVSASVFKLEPHYLAIGRISDVFRCNLLTQDGVQRNVAVKVLRGRMLGEAARKKFRKDLAELVRIWQQMSHPNIMECYGTCHDFGHLPGLVLPMCHGSIVKYLQDQDHHGTPKLDLLVQVAAAVSHLHSFGIIHADIRGASILMREHTPLLMDTGLAPLIKCSDFTVAGMYGRPRWMAPEILDPPEDVSIGDMGEIMYTTETDVYAFGMTILEVMTGNLPYSHRRYDSAVMLDVVRGVRPNRPRDPSISDDVWAIITTCWAMQPEKRPSAALVESWLNVARFSDASIINGGLDLGNSV